MPEALNHECPLFGMAMPPANVQDEAHSGMGDVAHCWGGDSGDYTAFAADQVAVGAPAVPPATSICRSIQ